MNLRDKILKEHSRKNCDAIVAWVGKSQQRFDELFTLFTNDVYRVVQRSAWPVSYCVEAHPIFIKKYFAVLLNNIKKPNIPDAVKRNTLRLLQFVNIPENHHGEVMNTCFEIVQSMQEKPAVKMFSLVVLDKLANTYPEIKPELLLIIETQMPYESLAFKSRGKKILAKK
jgi:hypothetical protein